MAEKPVAPDLKAAIAEAVEANPLEDDFNADWDRWDSEGGAPEASDTEGTPASDAAPDESQSQTAQGSEGETTPEAAVTVQEEDVPTSFWGIDLSDIPADARKAVLERLEQQEGTIHKLQQRLAQEPKELEPVAPPETPTDEDILRGLGLDPEYTSGPERDALLAMAKATMALEQRVEDLSTKDTTREVETFWNKSLDDLENEYGKLPFSRLQVLQYAVEEGLADPVGVYFRLAAPVKKEVEAAANEARKAALRKEVGGQVKPRNVQSGPMPLDKGLSLRDAVAQAARQAEKETKISWRDSIKKRLVQT